MHHVLFNFLISFRLILKERFFDGAVFVFEERKVSRPIKMQFQENGKGWEEMNESLCEVEMTQGSMKIKTNAWKNNVSYNVRVLISEPNDHYIGMEYYGCTVKGKLYGIKFGSYFLTSKIF